MHGYKAVGGHFFFVFFLFSFAVLFVFAMNVLTTYRLVHEYLYVLLFFFTANNFFYLIQFFIQTTGSF